MSSEKYVPDPPDTVKWYHQIAAAPLNLMSALNIGPFGGENAISAVIEAILTEKRGEKVTFPLSKSDQFFIQQFTKIEPPDEIVEYRELSHAAQHVLLDRFGEHSLGVIWLGAGVFTTRHPLLNQTKQQDFHIWTDSSLRLTMEAESMYHEQRSRLPVEQISLNVMLPQDVDKLNAQIDFLQSRVDHIVLFGYGVTYALLGSENYEWLSKLDLPDNLPISFVFNAPGEKLDFMPAVMAAFHDQRMVYYTTADIEALFAATIPQAKIIWENPRSKTRTNVWGTWVLHRPALKQ